MIGCAPWKLREQKARHSFHRQILVKFEGSQDLAYYSRAIKTSPNPKDQTPLNYSR